MDRELELVAGLTATFTDARHELGDTVTERLLGYAADRAGIRLVVVGMHPPLALPDPRPAPPAPEPALALRRPSQSRVSDWPRPCPYCDTVLNSAGGWASHVRRRHPEQPVAYPDPDPPAAQPTPDPEPEVEADPAVPALTLLADSPALARQGQLAHAWRQRWPRPCPECWTAGVEHQERGPSTMAAHRWTVHGIAVEAQQRLIESLRQRPAVESRAGDWSCAQCHSAAFAEYRDSGICVRCHQVGQRVAS